MRHGTVLIVGAGSGLSASLARLFARNDYAVALAARDIGKLSGLCRETEARAFVCDASEPEQVTRLFADVEQQMEDPQVVIFNAGARVRGPIATLDPLQVRQALEITAYAGFLVGHEAARRMLKREAGAIFFTGASASVKGYAESAPFAMGKFALRGLAQSMARELAPHGIHVGHFVIDGQIRSAGRSEDANRPESMLDPDAIAANYLYMLNQPRSAWTWEIELRPWVEKF
jgi:NAD(P)-dependent dehydrogenase (short-subunit alcohol dehydrogenase family)